ncbi:MAG: TIGR02646 family protein [Myxococcales bacterium]|nr:TIGR02646 family protein [Myxococcales bacterium]
MKNVPRLTSEPIGLQNFRKEQENADRQRDSADLWKAFRDTSAYKELQEALLDIQGGLCGYCERQIGHKKFKADRCIEHVAAKKDNRDRTLDWNNLMICCNGGTLDSHPEPLARHTVKRNHSCDKKKDRQKIPIECDPREFPCEWSTSVVSFTIDGRMRPNEQTCRELGIDPKVLVGVIENTLNLNCERLRQARQQLWDEIDQANDNLDQDYAEQKDTEGEIFFIERLLQDHLDRNDDGNLLEFWSVHRQSVEYYILRLPELKNHLTI